MEKAISYINVLPSKSEEVRSFADQIINEVKAGNVNPLELKAQMKWIEKALEQIDKGIKDDWQKEADKYGKSFEFKGFQVDAVETGIRYVFNDPELDKLKQMVKDRENMLKALREPLNVFDEATGETSTLYPPVKKSTSSYKFSVV